MYRIIFLFFFLIVTLFSTRAAKIETYFDTTNILIGDQIHFNMVATVSKEEDVHFPVFLDTLVGGIEVLGHVAVDSIISKDGKTFRKRILITSFDSGSYLVQELPFEISDVVDSSQRRVMYSYSTSLNVDRIAVDETKAIKPIKTILYFSRSYVAYILIFIAILALLLLGVYGYNKYFRKKTKGEKHSIPSLSPLEEIKQTLGELEKEKAYENALNNKYFHTTISEIVRRFIEREYLVLALEKTTDEILTDLLKSTFAEKGGDSDLLRKVLQFSDLVKFSKYTPSIEENIHIFGNTKELVLKIEQASVKQNKEQKNNVSP